MKIFVKREDREDFDVSKFFFLLEFKFSALGIVYSCKNFLNSMFQVDLKKNKIVCTQIQLEIGKKKLQRASAENSHIFFFSFLSPDTSKSMHLLQR